jgi:hypothetical protein
MTVGVLAIVEVATNFTPTPPPRCIGTDAQMNLPVVIPYNFGWKPRRTLTMVANAANPVFEINPESDIAGTTEEGTGRNCVRVRLRLDFPLFFRLVKIQIKEQMLCLMTPGALDEKEVAITVYRVHSQRPIFLTTVHELPAAITAACRTPEIPRMESELPDATQCVPETETGGSVEKKWERFSFLLPRCKPASAPTLDVALWRFMTDDVAPGINSHGVITLSQ